MASGMPPPSQESHLKSGVLCGSPSLQHSISHEGSDSFNILGWGPCQRKESPHPPCPTVFDLKAGGLEQGGEAALKPGDMGCGEDFLPSSRALR